MDLNLDDDAGMMAARLDQVLRSPVRRLSLNADEADDSSDHSFTVGSPRGRHVAQSCSPRGAASRSREHDASSPVSRTRYDRERLGGGDGINGGNYQQNHNHTPKLLSEDLIQGRKEWHNIQAVVRLAFNTLVHEMEKQSRTVATLEKSLRGKAGVGDIEVHNSLIATVQAALEDKPSSTDIEVVIQNSEQAQAEQFMLRVHQLYEKIDTKADASAMEGVESALLEKANAEHVQDVFDKQAQALVGAADALNKRMEAEFDSLHSSLRDTTAEIRRELDDNVTATAEVADRLRHAKLELEGALDTAVSSMEATVAQCEASLQQEVASLHAQVRELTDHQSRSQEQTLLLERRLQEMQDGVNVMKDSFHDSTAGLAETLSGEREERQQLAAQVQLLQKQLRAGLDAQRAETHRALDQASESLARAQGASETELSKLRGAAATLTADLGRERAERMEGEMKASVLVEKLVSVCAETAEANMHAEVQALQKDVHARMGELVPKSLMVAEMDQIRERDEAARRKMDNVHLQIQETTQNARALEESVRVGFAEAAAASKEAVEAVARQAEHAAERLQTTLVAQMERDLKAHSEDHRGAAADHMHKLVALAETSERFWQDAQQALRLRPTWAELEAPMRAKASQADVERGMQLRPTLSELEARLECKADRKQTEHELSRRALWSDVDQAVAKTMPAETTQKLLDAKADRSEVEKVMEAHDRTMQQVATGLMTALDAETVARNEATSKVSGDVTAAAAVFHQAVEEEARERTRAVRLLQGQVEAAAESASAASKAHGEALLLAEKRIEQSLQATSQEMARVDGGVEKLRARSGDLEERLGKLAGRTEEESRRLTKDLESLKSETSVSVSQTKAHLQAEVNLAMECARKATESNERTAANLSACSAEMSMWDSKLEGAQERIRRETLEMGSNIKTEIGLKLERKANLHDMMGRHAELTEALSRKIAYNELEGYSSPRLDDAHAQLAQLRATMDAVHSSVKMQVHEMLEGVARVDQVQRLVDQRASIEDLSSVKHELVVVETRVGALRDEMGGIEARTGQALVVHEQGSLSRASQDVQDRYRELENRSRSLTETVERLAEVVRTERTHNRSQAGDIQSHLEKLETTVRVQWEETCRGLDMAAEVARQAQREVELVDSQLRSHVASIEDTVLQERVDRLESLNPVKEQLQNATAMVEAQRNRTRSGLDVAAELTNKLQETLTAVGSDLREVIRGERQERLDKERELQSIIHRLETLSVDERNDSRRQFDSLGHMLQQFSMELASTKSGLKKVDRLEQQYEGALRRLMQRPAYIMSSDDR